MKPILTGFRNSPDRGRGHARDFRVRWALEEVGQPYDLKLVTFAEMKEAAYKAEQPFGQIPAYIEGDLTLFETGAILFHIAETHAGLFPVEAHARARVITWMFSALNTVEPPIVEREAFLLLEKEKPYFNDRLPLLEERVRKRLSDLSSRLAAREWLEDQFSAADILMITVLRRPAGAQLASQFPNLAAYVLRGESRPAFKRAFESQQLREPV